MRSRNSFVNVYINDHLIYEDNTNISRMFDSSPGSRWHQIPIGLNDDPVRLCLEVTACFYNSHGMVDSIYIGKENDVYNKVVSSSLFGFIVSSFFI